MQGESNLSSDQGCRVRDVEQGVVHLDNDDDDNGNDDDDNGNDDDDGNDEECVEGSV